MKALSRERAIKLGDATFRPDAPCPRGHFAVRHTDTDRCTACETVPARTKGPDPRYAACLAWAKAKMHSLRSRPNCDLDVEWLAAKVMAEVARGTVTLCSRSPTSASVDQSIPGLGYTKANAQIVPLWFNFAKNHWIEADVRKAIRVWCKAQKIVSP